MMMTSSRRRHLYGAVAFGATLFILKFIWLSTHRTSYNVYSETTIEFMNRLEVGINPWLDITGVFQAFGMPLGYVKYELRVFGLMVVIMASITLCILAYALTRRFVEKDTLSYSCDSCGYSFINNESNRCPECGQAKLEKISVSDGGQEEYTRPYWPMLAFAVALIATVLWMWADGVMNIMEFVDG